MLGEVGVGLAFITVITAAYNYNSNTYSLINEDQIRLLAQYQIHIVSLMFELLLSVSHMYVSGPV